MKDTTLYFCDVCGKLVNPPTEPIDPVNSFCPECAAILYQKIFGDEEDEQ